MEKIKNLSIRKTIILYMGINLILCFFLSVAFVYSADNWQQRIWEKYTDQDVLSMEAPAEIPRVSNYEMTDRDAFFSEVCDMLQTWSMLFIPSIGMVITVFLFYRNKIKTPLKELVKGSAMISKNDLEFSLNYSNKDELGTLCKEFEKMRKELAENNRCMWKLIEQEKTLKAAIAHDIRSPLTTLRGYQEMLLEFVPDERLDKQRLMEILESGMTQIDRLNAFVDTMTNLSRLENREIQRRKLSLSQLTEEIRRTAEALLKDTGKNCSIILISQDRSIYADQLMVLETAENLISNALRYAEKDVEVELAVSEAYLEIIVSDDGNGFQDETEKAVKQYYHTNPQDNLIHFGLGLYLCRLYCEKHGGRLLVRNRKQGGAQVKAVFQI